MCTDCHRTLTFRASRAKQNMTDSRPGGRSRHGRQSRRRPSPTWLTAARGAIANVVDGASTPFFGGQRTIDHVRRPRTEGAYGRRVRRVRTEGAYAGVGEKVLLEADVTRGGHATQQRKGQGDDAEGDGQADTHQRVVVRPELRDGGAR